VERHRADVSHEPLALRRRLPSIYALDRVVDSRAMALLTSGRIRHSVVFRLKHSEGSAAETDFLRAVGALGSIPGVEAFELMREVSPKNDYRFALTMEFADRAAYDAYNAHADHVAFVQGCWVPEVKAFLELDSEML
jgi:quinol monooxygenase YgiN